MIIECIKLTEKLTVNKINIGDEFEVKPSPDNVDFGYIETKKGKLYINLKRGDYKEFFKVVGEQINMLGGDAI